MSMAGTGICLFGGAFNPPHLSHRRIATAALAALSPARLLVVPCADHPHKHDPDMPAVAHRLAMCELAFAGIDARVSVSDREARRPGASFTVDTVRALRAEFGLEDPLWVLIGSDNLPLLPTWHDHHSLLELATIVTVPRAGHPATRAVIDRVALRARHKRDLLAHVLDVPADAVNATELRRRLGRGEPTPDLLPAVADYAKRHGLYAPQSG